jgi:hypothetical protein
LLVPFDLSGDPQVAVMRRFYLNAGDDGGGGWATSDPRQLPGCSCMPIEFGIGTRQIGRLDAEIPAIRWAVAVQP